MWQTSGPTHACVKGGPVPFSRMAFISYVAEEELAPDQRVPDKDNIIRIHAVHPAVMRQHYELYLQLMHRSGPLSRRLREMLAVRISAINNCHY